MKGKVIINFNRDEESEKCSYKLKQEGDNILSKEDIISLFQHIISELISEEN